MPTDPDPAQGLYEALDCLPDVKAALNRGWKFNSYERVSGGYYISLGPITNRPLALATTDDQDVAEFIVQALRQALSDYDRRAG